MPVWRDFRCDSSQADARMRLNMIAGGNMVKYAAMRPEGKQTVLKVIRRPDSVSMCSAKNKDTVRKKTFEWVCAGLTHRNAGVCDNALVVLSVLPREEVDAIVANVKGKGVLLCSEIGKCNVCTEGKVETEVDLGVCPACGGVGVRAEKYKRISTEDLCKMCQGNGRRSGMLVAVCEHCQGNWDKCPTMKFHSVETHSK